MFAPLVNNPAETKCIAVAAADLVGEAHNDDGALRFPMATLWHLVASAFGQVSATILGDHRPDLRPVFFELGGVGDDVLDDQVGCHLPSPSFAARVK
jgi:hypothetical protein